MKPAALSIAVAVALFGMGTTPLHAQQETGASASDDASRLDTITVTARRREESAQSVPVAVSAFDQEDLRELQANNVDGLQGAVPNLNIVQGRGSSNSVNVFIRGIGQPDALQTFDPGVGMYVDDVYYSRINGALFSLFDVQQIEVLRGPQGTLYGKNSTGGAIKVVTRDPSDFTEGSVEVVAGDHGRLEGRFYGSMPLNEMLSASLAAVSSGNDGYVTDPLTGRDYNEDDTSAARLKFLLRPSEEFEASFSIDYTRQDNALTLGQPVAPLIQTDLVLGPVVLRPPVPGEYNFESSTSFGPGQGQELTHKGGTAILTWGGNSPLTVKSITAYRALETSSYIDIDASEFELGDVLVALDQNQFSQEVQFQYDNGDNLESVFGLYYLREHVPSEQFAFADDLFALGGTTVNFLRSIDDDLETTSRAAFAHVDWEFMPTWTLAAGLRYTKETKDYWRTTSTFWGPALAALNETVTFDAERSWDAWTPSLSLQKAFSDQTMAYFSASRGFKSGGFNGRANSALETTAAEFSPEYVWTYELGLKMSSPNGRLLGNIAAFRSDYEDFQARVSEVLNPDAPTPTFSFPVLNAAELTIEGIEFEGMALIGSGTRLSAQIGLMDASYERFDDLRVTDPANPAYNPNLHDHVPFSPDMTARVAATQSFYSEAGSVFTIGADASYRDEVWLSVDNREALSQSAYTLYGLFGVWDSPDGSWQVRAGVRNLTDKVYKTEGQEFSSVGNIQSVYYGWPRNYYASLRFNF